MRWTRALVGVVASLANFATSAATNDDVPGERERERSSPQRYESTGYAAWGPSFYVWEEDSEQGRRWLAELSRASHPAPGAPAQNFQLPNQE